MNLVHNGGMNGDLSLIENDEAPASTVGAATREAIKVGAKRAIAVNGFSRVRIADITRAAGKSPAAFYLYFDGKDALLHELLSDFESKLLEQVSAPPSPGEDIARHLANRLQAFWRIYREDWPIATAAFQMSMTDQQFARAWHTIRQKGIRAFAAMVRRAQAAGGAAGLDPELLASAVTSMIEYACYNWTAKGGDFPERHIDDKTAVDVLSHVILQAVTGKR